MAKEVTNRSSEGVRAQYFPRADLPQQGWISVQERSLAGIRTPPRIEELNSFRSDDRRTKQRQRVHHADFSQQWWGTFVPVIGATIARQDPSREEANDCDRAFDPTIKRKRNRAFYHNACEQTESNVFSAGGFDPAVESWGIPSSRSTKRKLWPIDNMDVDWISATFAAGLDPSLYPWLIPSTDRPTVDRSLYHDQEKRTYGGGSSGPAPAPPYDPTQMGWSTDSGIPASKKKPRAWLDALPSIAHFGLLDSRLTEPSYDQLWNAYLPKSGRKRASSTEPSSGWAFVILPASFDPTLSPQSGDARMGNRAKARPQFDQPLDGWQYTNLPTPFDPQFSPDSADGRMAARYKKYPQLDQPQDGWLFTNLPAGVDPSLLPQWVDGRAPLRRRAMPQQDPLQNGWVASGLFDPQYAPQSSDVRSRAQHKRVPQLDQAQDGWITLNIPPPFDNRLTPYSTDARSRERVFKISRMQHVYYYDYASLAWVHDLIPLVDPIVQNATWRPVFGRRRRP